MTERIILKGSSKLLMPVITQIMAVHQLLDQKDIGIIYATDNKLEKVHRQGKPKIVLSFLEDTDYSRRSPRPRVAEGRRRQEGVISFRLMNETTATFSSANALGLGRKIKEIFGANDGYVWNKGKTMFSYTDWNLGYQFQLLCRNETEAKRIITSTLLIQNHTSDWINFNKIEADNEMEKYPEAPGNHMVMGESVPKPQLRPLVKVRFQYAYASLGGVKEPVTLFDRTGKRTGALVR